MRLQKIRVSKSILVLITILLVVSGFAVRSLYLNNKQKALQGRWIATSLKDIEIKQSITLTFDEDGFTANASCNGINGNYILGITTLAFTNIFTTLMFCEETMDQEAAFTNYLNTTKYYIVSDNALTLKDSSSNQLVVLRKS